MEIDDNEDLNITTVSSNANVDTTSYLSTDERNAPHSSAIDCENEPSSSQLVSPLSNLTASRCEFSLPVTRTIVIVRSDSTMYILDRVLPK